MCIVSEQNWSKRANQTWGRQSDCWRWSLSSKRQSFYIFTKLKRPTSFSSVTISTSTVDMSTNDFPGIIDASTPLLPETNYGYEKQEFLKFRSKTGQSGITTDFQNNDQISSTFSARFVRGFKTLSGFVNPQVLIESLWFSKKYSVDPLWFHHKSSPVHITCPISTLRHLVSRKSLEVFHYCNKITNTFKKLNHSAALKKLYRRI